MDPTTKAIHNFQEEFRSFREEKKARLLLILSDPVHTQTLIKLLRAEEWSLENQSPYLIFDNAYTEARQVYRGMSSTLIEHYRLLREGLVKQGIELSEWRSLLTGKEDPLTGFAMHLENFVKNLREPLHGLWVCWLPTSVSDSNQWCSDVQTLLKRPVAPNVRFIISDGKHGSSEAPVRALGDKARTIEFIIDEKEMLNFFKKLSTPSGGTAHPGTMPGAARPDVEPPPRLHGPKLATKADLRSAVRSGTVPPVLLPSQGVKLRQLILEAATAIAEKRPKDALKWQQDACLLCAEAGTKVEQSLMTLLLANYSAQYDLPDQATQRYREAAILAEGCSAYPQAAQARLALGYFFLKTKLPELAGQEYELAAAAALKGKTVILRIEALRMAGTCFLQCGRKQDALRCWQTAVETGHNATADEIRHSTLREAGILLVALLKAQHLESQARSVEELLRTLAEKSGNSTEEEGP